MKDPTFGLLLVLPLLLWVAVTLLYPAVDAVRISFSNVRYVGLPIKYVGLTNFKHVLSEREFWDSVIRTVIWSVSNVALQLVGSLGVALVLNQEYKGKEFIRNWIILPWVLPTIVLAIVWKWILDPTHGVANYILIRLGIVERPIEFLSSTTWTLPTAILLNCWRWIPYFSVIVLAALQTVPKELHEAAAIDGASRWKRFTHITLPFISPVLKVIALNSLLWSANIFDTIWLLTRGGPLDHTTTLPIYIYSKAFRSFRFSEAAAAILMFLGLLLLVIIYLRILFKEEGAQR
ncbi:MAG: sugar ABC transporter permease [Thermococcus sp.]|nr:sugar ABC transporter permease [Thermococcus sp.]